MGPEIIVAELVWPVNESHSEEPYNSFLSFSNTVLSHKLSNKLFQNGSFAAVVYSSFHTIFLPALVFANSLSLASTPGRMKTNAFVQRTLSLPFNLLLILHHRAADQPRRNMLTALFLTQ